LTAIKDGDQKGVFFVRELLESAIGFTEGYYREISRLFLRLRRPQGHSRPVAPRVGWFCRNLDSGGIDELSSITGMAPLHGRRVNPIARANHENSRIRLVKSMRNMPLLLADSAILCLACIRSLLTGSRDANRWGPLQPGVDSICRVQPNDRYSSHSPANKEAPSLRIQQ
jgi:hypothetical protein